MSEINDIDVSECEHYKNNGKCRIPHYQQGIKYVSCNCNEWDCAYKQLRRLQEENEQLQKRFNDYQDRKIEENANLMKRLDIADKKLTVFSRELKQANKENDKYKQALEEIKEIVSGNYEILDPQAKQDIKKLIDEVLNDRD